MSAVGSTVGSSVGDADGTRVINMVGASVGSLVTMTGAGDGSEREQPSVGRHVPVVKHHHGALGSSGCLLDARRDSTPSGVWPALDYDGW